MVLFVFLVAAALLSAGAKNVTFVAHHSDHKFHDVTSLDRQIDGNNKTVTHHHHHHGEKAMDEQSHLSDENDADRDDRHRLLNHKVMLDTKPPANKVYGDNIYNASKVTGDDPVVSCHLIDTSNKSRTDKRKVLLVSLDGFRWDFRSKVDTPNLDRVAREGVSVEFALNVFPTITLPNHQSVVTGLYPEHHGIIGNSMLDKKTGRVFKGQSDPEWWNMSTPIWITNQRQGHQSGVSFWPGFRVRYNGMQPSYLPEEIYARPGEEEVAVVDENTAKVMSINERISQTVDWLKNDDVTFAALYLETVDKVVHELSPSPHQKRNRKLVKKAISKVDSYIGDIRDQLEKFNLNSKVDLIITGDHGFVKSDSERVIVLDDFVNASRDILTVHGMTSAFVTARPNRTRQLYEQLKNASRTRPFKVYASRGIPAHFRLQKSARIGDMLLLADPGYTIVTRANRPPYLHGKFTRGEHGYSNFVSEMHPAFFAVGPSFRAGYRQWCVKLIDIYPLMCHILNIKPQPHDACFERVKPLLKQFVGEVYRPVYDKYDPIIC